MSATASPAATQISDPPPQQSYPEYSHRHTHYLVVTVDHDGHIDVQSSGDIDFLVLDHNQLLGDIDKLVADWRDASDYPPRLRQHIQRMLIR